MLHGGVIAQGVRSFSGVEASMITLNGFSQQTSERANAKQAAFESLTQPS